VEQAVSQWNGQEKVDIRTFQSTNNQPGNNEMRSIILDEQNEMKSELWEKQAK
jgi:hypothetical protein